MLRDYIGQRDSLTPLLAALEASKVTRRPLPHALFLGKPGTGKTELAKVTAREVGGPCVIINAATVKDSEAISQAAVRAQGGVLFLDEIHALDRKQAECLFTLLDTSTVTVQQPVIGAGWTYQWIESEADWPTGTPGYFYGPGLYEIQVPVETRQTYAQEVIVGEVTVIGATTDEAMLPPALLSRLSRLLVRLRPYNIEELATIAARFAEESLSCTMDGEAAVVLAQRSRQSPRRIKQLTERASDYAVVDGGIITIENAEAALAAAGVDENGLEAPHREMLRLLVEAADGLSRTSLAQRMGLPPRNAELYWGDLLAQGFVTIGRRHEATEAGRAVMA